MCGGWVDGGRWVRVCVRPRPRPCLCARWTHACTALCLAYAFPTRRVALVCMPPFALGSVARAFYWMSPGGQSAWCLAPSKRRHCVVVVVVYSMTTTTMRDSLELLCDVCVVCNRTLSTPPLGLAVWCCCCCCVCLTLCDMTDIPTGEVIGRVGMHASPVCAQGSRATCLPPGASLLQCRPMRRACADVRMWEGGWASQPRALPHARSDVCVLTPAARACHQVRARERIPTPTLGLPASMCTVRAMPLSPSFMGGESGCMHRAWLHGECFRWMGVLYRMVLTAPTLQMPLAGSISNETGVG